MNLWRAAAAAIFFLALIMFQTGCGDVYRPVATPQPTQSSNPSGIETEVVLSCCLNPSSLNAVSPNPSSILTEINVAGDANSGNKVLNYQTGTTPLATMISPPPLAFDASRVTVYTANTASDTVNAVTLSGTGSFSATTTSIALESGAAPSDVAFEFFGLTYPQNFVVNSGTTTTCKQVYSLQTNGASSSGGSISVIAQASNLLKATVCLAPNAAPTLVWPYYDMSKVFVLDTTNNLIYVVSTSKYLVTNTIPLPAGSAPFKVAQTFSGRYLFVLNGNGTISIIDGQIEQLLGSVSIASGSSAPVIDITQIFNTPAVTSNPQSNTESNHIWVLQSDGTVSVWDDTLAPTGTMTLVTTVPTISATELAAGATATNIALLRDGTYAYVGVGGTDKVMAIQTSALSHDGTASTNATTTITVGVHHGSPQSPVAQNLSYTYNQLDDTGKVISTLAFSGSNLNVEVTTPVVTAVAVSRQGTSAGQSKAYALTTTNTIFNCYSYNPNYNPSNPSTMTVVPAACDDNTIGNVFATGTTVVDSGYSATPPLACGANQPPVPAGEPSHCYPVFLPSPPASCTVSPAGSSTMSCPNLYNGTAVITAAEGQSTTVDGQTNAPVPINTYIGTIASPFMVTYCDGANMANGSFDAAKNCPVTIPVSIIGRN
jgi:hypothetical protein